MLRLLRSKIHKKWSRIYYVVETANWSVRWDGMYVTSNVERLFNVKSQVVTTCAGIRNQVLHMGTRGLYLPYSWKHLSRSNRIIFTWFHGDKDDKNSQNLAMIDALPDATTICEFIHTTNIRTKNRLIEWGVQKDKIVTIPIGVDLTTFTPASEEVKKKIRKELKIPEGRICIGSFQKDGVGWGEGNKPKLVKGPDIFCDTVIELSNKYPIYVILIGPARGYVKKRLTEAGIPFFHNYLENFLDITRYYHALDIYMVTSRDEGGPKGILESMASGIPLVTTDVGIARDIVTHGKNGFIAEIENVDEIVRFSSYVLDNQDKTAICISNALEAVKLYSWENIARQYYTKMYSKLLANK